MTLLRLDEVTVRFGRRDALDAVDLEVAEHETVCVLGPSGSGKSTMLRVVAGLQRADAGRVWLAGRDQSGVPVHRRGVGLMFQDHQLFPQRDVGGNVAFGLRMRKVGRAEADRRVAELLELVGLPGAQRRPVDSLSGGEQQRVALARALAPRPKVLMLDEPLGQLDQGLRERLVVELRELFERLGTTVLVVMENGRIAQTGSPLEVWQRPATEFVARFLGFDNVVEAVVRGETAETRWGELPVPPGSRPGSGRLLVRPAGVRLTDPGEGLACTVAARTFRGDHVALVLRPSDPAAPRLEASCPLRDAPEAGTRVGAAFDPAEVVVLDPAP